jgi:surface antigen
LFYIVFSTHLIPEIDVTQSMPPLRALIFGLSVAGLSLSPSAHALGYWGTYSSTMWNTPSEYFTPQDWEQFEGTLRKTLDAAPDGQANAWSNSASKASGEFTILKSVRKNDQDCREVKITASAGGLRRVTGVAFCKEDDGTWTAIPGKGRK